WKIARTENPRAPSRNPSKSRRDTPTLRPRPSVVAMATIRSGSSNGSPRMRTAFTNVKTASFAPSPSASATTATAVNHLSLTSRRTAYLMSWSRVVTSTRSLLVAQRHDRVHLRRPEGWNIARQQSHAGQQQRDRTERRRVGGADAEQQVLHDACRREGRGCAYRDPGQRHRHRALEHRSENGAPVGAERHSDSDFLGALGDGVRNDAVDTNGR